MTERSASNRSVCNRTRVIAIVRRWLDVVRLAASSPIGRRWLDIALLSACGCLVGWAILSLRIPLPDWIVENAETLTTGWKGFLLMTAFWGVAFSGGGLRVAISRRSCCRNYPPLAVPVLLVGLLTTVVLAAHTAWTFFPHNRVNWHALWQMTLAVVDVATPVASFILGMILKDVVCFRLKEKGGIQIMDEPARDPDLPDDLQWILDERPVRRLKDDDKFHQGPLVRRLGGILRDADGKSLPKTIGLVGPYGSGKSSIVNFVESELHDPSKAGERRREDIVFVRVPGWGIADHGLTGFVLQCVVDKLEKEGIDCLAIRGLPDEYLAAIGVANEKAGRIAAAFCAPVRSPQAVLDRLEPILDAMGLLLVLCIEDAERGASKDTLQELAALLDRFRHMRRITFIVEANQNSHEHLGLARICDHVERVPSMPPKGSWHWLRKFRQACMGFAREHGDIMPAEEATTNPDSPPVCLAEDLFWSAPMEPSWGVLSPDSPDDAFRRHIGRSMGTPRAFKHGLRLAWIAWKDLHGEVDLRELIMLNLLRNVAPEAWEFVVDNIERLQGIARLSSQRSGEDIGTRRNKIAEDWNDVAARLDNSDACLTLMRVIDINFTDRQPDIYCRKGNLQSLHDPSNGLAYFNRILAMAVDEGELRDQDVLRSLYGWRNGEGIDLAKCILDKDGFADKIEQFRSFLGNNDEDTGRKQLKLCEQYIALALSTFGPKANRELNGFDMIATLATTGRVGVPEYGEWIKARLDQALAVSLAMAFDICNHIGGKWLEGPSEFRTHLAENMLKNMEYDDGYLGRVLDPDRHYTLFQMIRKCNLPAPKDWIDYFPRILRAAEQQPAVVVPHLVLLLSRKSDEELSVADRGECPTPYRFESEYAGKLISCQENRQRLLRLLQSYSRQDGAIPETVNRIRIVEPEIIRFADMKTGLPSDKKVQADEVDDPDSEANPPATTPNPSLQNDSGENDSAVNDSVKNDSITQ